MIDIRNSTALENWGFLTVVNHGVLEEAMAAVMEMSRGFFENPTLEDVRYWRDYLKLILHPNFHCPSKPHGFREAVAEYSSSIMDDCSSALKVR